MRRRRTEPESAFIITRDSTLFSLFSSFALGRTMIPPLLLFSLLLIADNSRLSSFVRAEDETSSLSAEEIKAKCRSTVALRSCGECIKQHSECAWCADPRSNISSRCDVKSAIVDSGVCAKQSIYSPNTEIKIAPQHNLPLGGSRPDIITPIQLEPQQVEIRLKPGDVVEVPFRYLHKAPASGYEVKDFNIQTSGYESLGLKIDFFIDCHGERKAGRVCPGVELDEKISFTAKISLKDCTMRNLAAVSVGVYGYNTVSALFVYPMCGCDCENPRFQERRSPQCGYQGNMVCGVCQCEAGKGGRACECDLTRLGVSNADELIGQCKADDSAAICSGKGKCSCGRCVCDADYITGRFCECDSGSCPLNVAGRTCSGRGECNCGRCVCENGFSGDDCSCSADQSACTENGVVCSEHGFCECGKCSCNDGWTGATCSVEQLEAENNGEEVSKEDESRDDEAEDENSDSSSMAADSSEMKAEDEEPSGAETRLVSKICIWLTVTTISYRIFRQISFVH